MLSNWFSTLATLAIFFGFSGLLGSLINRLRAEYSHFNLLTSAAFGVLVILPASIALPLVFPVQALTWIVAAVICIVFTLRPQYLPTWLWTQSFGLRYAAGAMALILFWSLANIFSPQALLLGSMASFAASLAWQRSAALTS